MLHLLTALRPEARPFVDAWSLRRDPDVSGFDLYEGELDDAGVRLVRAGLGKAHMAAAVGWLAGRTRGRTDGTVIWLNVGIAGHGSLPTGALVMAHRVVDVGSGRSSYPPLVIEPPCPTCELRTVDVPETKYAEAAEVAFDMEGSAFVDAARRFATAELVHCLKVVSDGPEAPVTKLNRGRIAELVQNAVEPARELVLRLRPALDEVRAAEDAPPDYERLVASRHFTVSDRVNLKRQLRRRAALAPAEPLPEAVETAARGKQANRALETWLDGIAGGRQ